MIARLIASVALLLIATTVPPAQAAKEVDRDAKRDMVSETQNGYRDEPQMRAGDITRFTTLHGTRRITLTTKFAVRPNIDYFMNWTIVTPDHTYDVSRYKFGPSEGWVTITEDGADEPFDCPGMRVRARGDYAIALLIPRTCIHEPAWVRTGHFTFVSRNDLGYYDEARRDHSYNMYKRRLGTKVRVG